MPAVDVRLIAPHSGMATGAITAIVDSGADGTLVPVDLLSEIGAVSIATGRLAWLWRESRMVHIYVVQLEIGPIRLPKVRVAGVPVGTDLVLGRDVLNQMVWRISCPKLTSV
jgi:predicted aspartyl protease